MLLASDFDQSRFLKGEGFKQEKKFRIKEVTMEELIDRKGKAEKKLIVWFTNSEQGLSLNKTNLRTLQGAFGDNTEGWKNRVIVIFPVETTYGPGLRVRIPPPKQVAAVPQQTRTTAAPQQPATSGNGAAAPAADAAAVPLAVAALAAADPELEPDPVIPIGDEMDDEISY